jgi:glycosyltransferase involved in cell wall biosynthesis
MNTSELFTVVIPSYNEERYIYNTLWYLSRQELSTKIRVIICDASSTDKTLEHISKADNDFENLEIEIRTGGNVSYGRNKGAELVNTPFVLFLDADSVLLDKNTISETLNNAFDYDIIGCKQNTTSSDIRSWLTWNLFEIIRKVMPESFCTGCYFFISKQKFDELGGFDETLNNSEDFWLSRQVPKSRFKILDKFIGQDDRRFKKMGYLKFLKIVLLNYWNKNNINWFKKDVGYWDEYK